MKFDRDTHESMINAYFFIIKNETINEAHKRNNSLEIFYPFNPDDFKIKDIREVMDYFANPIVEDYEKSHEIKKHLNKLIKENK